MSDIISRFVKLHGLNIVSDGDLDAVFATGILLGALIKSGIVKPTECDIYFPRARELRNMEVSRSILVELNPERKLTYVDENILLDHHPDPPRIAVYRGSSISFVRKYNMPFSVAGLVGHIFRSLFDVPRDILEAVDEADYRNYAIELAHKINRAFLISRNIPDEKLYSEITDKITSTIGSSEGIIEKLKEFSRKLSIYGLLPIMIMKECWDLIYYWIEKESQRYVNVVFPIAKKLYNRSAKRRNTAFVIYNYGDTLERTAVGDVLYLLETENIFAFSIGITKRGFIVWIHTRRPDINLFDVFVNSRKLAEDSGGREDALSLYFSSRKSDMSSLIRIILADINNFLEGYR